MNTQEIIETLETMANVSWWRVLARQTAESDRLRREAEGYRRSAHRCRQQGDDATALDASAEEADRHAEKLDQIAREAWRRYWSAFTAVRKVAPQLLGVFPIANGTAAGDIDPKAAARSMNELVGKLLAVGNEPTRHDTTRHDTKDDIGKKVRKKRPMNTRAADCARRYREDKGRTPMKTVVEDYVFERGGSFDGIMKVLSDNPDQWKMTDQTRHKDDN